MAKQATLTNVSTGYSSNTTLNDNFEALNAALLNTVSIDGSTPNAMAADFDLNGNDVLNVGNLNVTGTLTAAIGLDADTLTWPDRTAANASAMVDTLSDGGIAVMGGLAYKKDSTATGTSSCTNDLGVDGLVPAIVTSLDHYGVAKDGVTDDTTKVQAAADFGGVINCPPGKYLLTDQVTIANGILQGSGFYFPAMLVSDASDLSGTVFICGFETATAESVIHLGQRGELRDALLYYPNQTATRPVSWTPTTTPWAVTGGAYNKNSRDIRENESGLYNVMFLEFTHGLRLNKGGERGVFEKVQGNCFTKFIEADGNYDVTKFVNCHHWPYGGETGNWQLEERKYTMNNCVVYGFGRVDGLIMQNCFTIGSDVAVDFFPSTETTNTDHATTNFHISDCYLDGCDTSLRVRGTYASGWRVSGHVTGGTMQHYDSADNEITTHNATVLVESDIKELHLTDVRLVASGGEHPGTVVEFASGSGKIQLNSCSTTKWDDDATGAPAFKGTAGTIIVNNHRFFQNNNTPIVDFSGLNVSTGNVLFFPHHPDMVIENTNLVTRWTKNSSGEGPELQLRASNGTAGTPTASANTDNLGDIVFFGYDGNSYESAALIRCLVDGTVSDGVVPSKIQFLVEDAAGAKAVPMQVTQTGAAVTGNFGVTGDINVTGNITANGFTSAGSLYSDYTETTTIRSGTVTIANDSVATIPTSSLIMGTMILWVKNGTAPAGGYHGLIYFDIEASPAIGKLSHAGGSLDTVTVDVTGTTGTAGNVTVSATNGALKIENRAGGSRDFHYIVMG